MRLVAKRQDEAGAGAVGHRHDKRQRVGVECLRGGKRDGNGERGGGVVGDDFGGDERHEVNAGEGDEDAFIVKDVLHESADELRRAGVVHAFGDGDGRADDGNELKRDAPPQFTDAGVAREQIDTKEQQQAMQQRQQVERFQEDGEDETGDGTVALAVGEARRGVAGTQYVEMFFQVGLHRKMTADGKDEAVADVQDGVAEAAGKALVAAADADDAGVEAAAEVDFLQGFIDEVGFVRDDRFDEVAGEQVARVFSEDFQAAKGLQAADMLNRAAENQLVAGADAHLRPYRRDEVIIALDFHQIEVVKPL